MLIGFLLASNKQPSLFTWRGAVNLSMHTLFQVEHKWRTILFNQCIKGLAHRAYYNLNLICTSIPERI